MNSRHRKVEIKRIFIRPYNKQKNDAELKARRSITGTIRESLGSRGLVFCKGE
jgi:hypothetical protein